MVVFEKTNRLFDRSRNYSSMSFTARLTKGYDALPRVKIS